MIALIKSFKKGILLLVVCAISLSLPMVSAQKNAFQLTKKTAITASLGLGLLGAVSKVFHDYAIKKQSIKTEKIVIACGIGVAVGLLSHMFLITKTSEWQKQREHDELSSLSCNTEDQIEQVKQLISDIEKEQPRQHESILDYAKRTYKTPWVLHSAGEAYEKFGNDLQGLLEGLEEKQQLLKQKILTTTVQNQSFFKVKFDTLIKQIPTIISKINGVRSSVNYVSKQILGHAQYQLHCALYREQELQVEVEKCEPVKTKNGQLKHENNQQAKKIEELNTTITTLREKIKQLERRLEKNTKSAEEPTCAICMDTVANNSGQLTTLCKHTFHMSCFMEHVKSGVGGEKCPVCRKDKPLGCSLSVQSQTGYRYS